MNSTIPIPPEVAKYERSLQAVNEYLRLARDKRQVTLEVSRYDEIYSLEWGSGVWRIVNFIKNLYLRWKMEGFSCFFLKSPQSLSGRVAEVLKKDFNAWAKYYQKDPGWTATITNAVKIAIPVVEFLVTPHSKMKLIIQGIFWIHSYMSSPSSESKDFRVFLAPIFENDNESFKSVEKILLSTQAIFTEMEKLSSLGSGNELESIQKIFKSVVG